MNKNDVVKKFGRVLMSAQALMLDVSVRAAARKPEPDRWSPLELLGHLVDSTANNHRRIVLALQQDDMVFDGYDQEGWVNAQQYGQYDWNELKVLWLYYNRLLLHTVKCTPEEKLLTPKARHTLDKILMKKFPADQPATVLALVDDYIDHAVHHFRQIARLTRKDFPL